jgi:hypothetical protein
VSFNDMPRTPNFINFLPDLLDLKRADKQVICTERIAILQICVFLFAKLKFVPVLNQHTMDALRRSGGKTPLKLYIDKRCGHLIRFTLLLDSQLVGATASEHKKFHNVNAIAP